jgi:hypothetical protein
MSGGGIDRGNRHLFHKAQIKGEGGMPVSRGKTAERVIPDQQGTAVMLKILVYMPSFRW